MGDNVVSVVHRSAGYNDVVTKFCNMSCPESEVDNITFYHMTPLVFGVIKLLLISLYYTSVICTFVSSCNTKHSQHRFLVILNFPLK